MVEIIFTIMEVLLCKNYGKTLAKITAGPLYKK